MVVVVVVVVVLVLVFSADLAAIFNNLPMRCTATKTGKSDRAQTNQAQKKKGKSTNEPARKVSVCPPPQRTHGTSPLDDIRNVVFEELPIIYFHYMERPPT